MDLLSEAFGEAEPAAAPSPVDVVETAAPLERLRAYAAGDPEALAALEELLEVDGGEESAAEVDTLEEAAAVLRVLKRRAARVPPAKLAAFTGTLLKTIAAVEAIQRRRPQPARPDEVHEAIRAAGAECAGHLLRYTDAAAQRWDRLLPRLRATLGIAAPELLVELDGLLGRPS